MKENKVLLELIVKETKVGILKVGNINYISITDLAKYQNYDDPSGVIRNWMSNKTSFAFYSLWEELSNPNFNSVESHGIKNQIKILQNNKNIKSLEKLYKKIN